MMLLSGIDYTLSHLNSKDAATDYKSEICRTFFSLLSPRGLFTHVHGGRGTRTHRDRGEKFGVNYRSAAGNASVLNAVVTAVQSF